MKIVEANNKIEYNRFVLDNNGNFQQSWEWGELNRHMKREVRRFLVMEDREPRAAASFVRHDLPLGKFYWLSARGPVISKDVILEGAPATDRILRDSIASRPRSRSTRRALQNDKEAIFIRIEPEVSSDYRSKISDYGLRPAPHDHSPRATILIDLNMPEDQLLSEMHSKARYNIRLAERKEVVVSTERLATNDFLDLLEKTSKRDKFSLHPRKYYEEMLKLPFVKLFTAYHKAELVAGAIISIYGHRATYLHGASDYRHRKLMAPYLLHWQIIRQAKQEGLKYYDLGGVAPKSSGEEHPWAGITRFKKGFGGKYVEYAGTWDYVLSPFWYTIYKIGRAIL